MIQSEPLTQQYPLLQIQLKVARFPVEAHPTADNPNSFAFEIATPAGLSLNEKVGLTESFLM